jgi:hypothetical protein
LNIEAKIEDFGPGACEYRKPYDADHFKCYSKTPLVKVDRSHIVPSDICRTCERKRKSNLTEKQVQHLKYLEEKERIKTEAKQARKAIHGENHRGPLIDFGSCSEYGAPDFRDYNPY